MVITTHINKWDVIRIIIDNGHQAEILFLSAFDHMGLDKNQVRETTKPLYGFEGKKVLPIGFISLLVSFGGRQNMQAEQVTFDVVDMYYQYNAILDRGFLNIFEAGFHSAYLCLKVSALLGALSIYGNHKNARNI
jgi:hypothetical protein